MDFKSKRHIPKNVASFNVPATIAECLAILRDYVDEQRSKSNAINFTIEQERYDRTHARFTLEQHVQIDSRAFKKLRLRGFMRYDKRTEMTYFQLKAELPSHETNPEFIMGGLLLIPCAIVLCASSGQGSLSLITLGINLGGAYFAWQWWEYDYTAVNDPRRFDIVDQIENALKWRSTFDE